MKKESNYSERELDKIIEEFNWSNLNQEELAKKLGMPKSTLSSITFYYKRRTNPRRKIGKQVREYLDNAHPLPKIIDDRSEVSKIMSLYIGSDISQIEIAKKVGLNNTVTSYIIRYFYRRGIVPSKRLPIRYSLYIDERYPLTKREVVKSKKDITIPKREISILWGLIKIKY